LATPGKKGLQKRGKGTGTARTARVFPLAGRAKDRKGGGGDKRHADPVTRLSRKRLAAGPRGGKFEKKEKGTKTEAGSPIRGSWEKRKTEEKKKGQERAAQPLLRSVLPSLKRKKARKKGENRRGFVRVPAGGWVAEP